MASYTPKYVYIDPKTGDRSLVPKAGYTKVDISGGASSTTSTSTGEDYGDLLYQPGIEAVHWAEEHELADRVEQNRHDEALATQEIERLRLAEQRAANARAAANAAGEREDAAAARELEAEIARERLELEREIAQLQHETDTARLALEQKQYEQTVQQWESALAANPADVVQYELYKRGEIEPMTIAPSQGSAAPQQSTSRDVGVQQAAQTFGKQVGQTLGGFAKGGNIAIVGDSLDGKPNPELLEVLPDRIKVTPLSKLAKKLQGGGSIPIANRRFVTGKGWQKDGSSLPPNVQSVLDAYGIKRPKGPTGPVSVEPPVTTPPTTPPATSTGTDTSAYGLPGIHTDEEMQALLSGAVGANTPYTLYNPNLGGTGVFGSHIPTPGELSRRRFLAMDPTQLGVLESFLKGGIDMGTGQRTAINPQDWLQMMQKSWIPGLTGLGSTLVQYGW